MVLSRSLGLVLVLFAVGCSHRGTRGDVAKQPTPESGSTARGARASGGAPTRERGWEASREFSDAQVVSVADAFFASMISQAQFAQSHAIDPGVRLHADRLFGEYVNARRNLQELGLGSAPNPTSQSLLQRASGDLTDLRNASGWTGDRLYTQKEIANQQDFQQMLNDRLIPSVSNELLKRQLQYLNQQLSVDARDAASLLGELQANESKGAAERGGGGAP
jgi:predicted outer membrane protein